MEANNLNLEKIFSIIKHSYSIDKHIDFFNWLQNSVNEILPHNLLLASWGDFENTLESNNLSYDVASNLTGISTQMVLDLAAEVDDLMMYLHGHWIENDRRWYVINQLQSRHDGNLPMDFISKLNQTNSLLVYGVSDVRGSNECLYVFFNEPAIFDVGDSVMGLIMPHIDTVLRKIQHIEPIEMPNALATVARVFSELSARELEIIHWVKSGKTNTEIGMILEISQNTVKSHLKRIFHKLNVTRRAQAVAMLSN
ncbi:MAG: helix-turn-helix transcriptional regulator [Methylotenera sp.]|nr:helix-turn-helix transcriptional regulator [Methylotenera sp.]